jgi:Rod binding domain-containing protein
MTDALASRSLTPVREGAGQEQRPPSASKLTKAAQEFESLLLQSWLEKMNEGFVGACESTDPAHNTVNSLGTQAIASALAARGGIGLAAMILRQLQPPAAARPSATPDK